MRCGVILGCVFVILASDLLSWSYSSRESMVEGLVEVEWSDGASRRPTEDEDGVRPGENRAVRAFSAVASPRGISAVSSKLTLMSRVVQ
jgi:hypothetical protein